MRAAPILALAALLCLPHIAAAAGGCFPRAEMLAYLAARYGEAPAARGVTDSGALVELLTAADGATWTVTVTSGRGITCALAAGAGWRVSPSRRGGSGIGDRKARATPNPLPDP